MIRVMSEPKTNYPRDLEDDFKMNFRAIPETHEAMASIMARVGGDKSIRFRGRLRPKRAQIANALFLYVASLPQEQQREMVKGGIALLNGLLRLPAESPQSEKPAEREAGGEEGRDVEGGGRRLPGPPSVIPPGSAAKPKRRRNQGG
jgi:hypothetical protein